MAPVFIFAKDIEKVLREGKNGIEIPHGARISSAAQDLIRDNRIEVTYVTSQPEVSKIPSPEQESPAEETTGPALEAAGGVSTREPGTEVSEEELEAIVTRVIARFQQVKGQAPTAPAGEQRSAADDDDLVICRCEEITRGEIKEVISNGMKTLNGIKRVTRAGMGLCQGQTCQRLVTQILAQELGINPAEVEPTTARAPVRPIPLSVFSSG